VAPNTPLLRPKRLRPKRLRPKRLQAAATLLNLAAAVVRLPLCTLLSLTAKAELPKTGGSSVASLFALGAGVLLVGGGLLARRISK
jgi:LPXTG-motif cell wall-anchored protein